MIVELLCGNLHSSLQLWEMRMPSCLKALIRKWAWNGIVLSRAWNNLFLTIELSRMEMYVNILSTTSKQVLFCSKFKNFFTWEWLSNHWSSYCSHFLEVFSMVRFLVCPLFNGSFWKLAFQSKWGEHSCVGGVWCVHRECRLGHENTWASVLTQPFCCVMFSWDPLPHLSREIMTLSMAVSLQWVTPCKPLEQYLVILYSS